MSGSPKYSDVGLSSAYEEQLARERRRRAAEDERRRREAAERERKRRLEITRRDALSFAGELAAEFEQTERTALHQADRAGLDAQLRKLNADIREGSTDAELVRSIEKLSQLQLDYEEAAARKRRDDEARQRREELDNQRFELAELRRQIALIPTADAQKFDSAGAETASSALQGLTAALSSGDSIAARPPLGHATLIVKRHGAAVAERKAEWTRRKAAAERATGELNALLQGLQADPVVMLWQPHRVSELQKQRATAEQSVIREDFDTPTQLLEAAQTANKTILEAASAAQLKADRRDYIAKSISDTLQGMGFVIVESRWQTPGHPASPFVFKGADARGKAIAISVPVEGQILYDVDGYHKGTEARIAGSATKTCDEAEQVLNEMRKRVETEFGVRVGEVTWEGKDPNRVLRQADQLPRSDADRKNVRQL